MWKVRQALFDVTVTMKLRDYQADAVAAVYGHLRAKATNPVVVIPTGGGKTPVIATICRDAVLRWKGRVMVLSHVKELLEQSARHLVEVEPKLAPLVGIYSAGLGSKDSGRPITVAGIQSIYKHGAALGKIDLILVDEAHCCPAEGEGMHRTFLTAARTVNPKIRLVGLTATPFRMKSGPICSPGSIFEEICYEVGIRTLINQGYLCKLTAFSGSLVPDTDS
ncbi:MAG: DEAD/DEAH box helicase family protein, partial [bacterium]